MSVQVEIESSTITESNQKTDSCISLILFTIDLHEYYAKLAKSTQPIPTSESKVAQEIKDQDEEDNANGLDNEDEDDEDEEDDEEFIAA